jgi:glutamyl-tRNA reductase
MIRIRFATPGESRLAARPRTGANAPEPVAASRTNGFRSEFLQRIAHVLPVSAAAAGRTISFVSALVALGLSHATAPLAVRERLALAPDEATALLRALRASGMADEAVAVSTCNRTELYLAAADAAAAEHAAVRALARHARLGTPAVRSRVAVRRGRAVAEHLFDVAAGLDSMVLGEAEILGQLRRAHELARAAGTCGPVLDRLLRDALGAGRRARAGSAIGRCGASVSSAAVELAREALGSLADRRVLLVGAGKSGETTARVLRGQGVRLLRVVNRDRARAAALAGGAGGVVPLAALADHLAAADLVLAATSSPRPLIARADVERATARRAPGRPLVLVDLAVPRDIDPAVRGVPGVVLVDLDDVERRAARNRAARAGEAGRARAILAGEVERFERWRAERAVAPAVAALHGRGDAVVQELLARNAPHWESLSPADRERVEQLARAVVRRLLHEPTLRLRRAAQEDGGEPARIALELFGLDGAAAARAASTDAA